MNLRIRSPLTRAPLPLLILMLGGCPWEGGVALGVPDPGLKLDARLLGAWHHAPQGGTSEADVRVIDFDGHQYLLEIAEPGKPPDRYRAFETAVGGRRFLNLQEIGTALGGPARFSLAVYDLAADGSLRVQMVDEHALPKDLATSRELKKRVAAGLGKPGFFAPDALDFTRGGGPATSPSASPPGR